MVLTRLNQCLGFLLATFVLLSAPAAVADCAAPGNTVETGSCQAQIFNRVNAELNADYLQLNAQLAPGGQEILLQREHAWLLQRDLNCTISHHGSLAVNFDCAVAMTLRQDKILSNWLDNPSTLPPGMSFEERPHPFIVGIIPWPPRPIPNIPPVVQSHAAGRGTHGCAIFGGTLPIRCQSYPGWITGTWLPPAGVTSVHVLVVGGGGGGSGSLFEGRGGPGGASGAVLTASITVGAEAVKVQVGQSGNGGAGLQGAGNDGLASQFGSAVAAGGGGGQTYQGGSTAGPGGSSGGGGSGGGYLAATSYHPGAGGSGGTAGASGKAGQSSTDPNNTIQGLPGGQGSVFPDLEFHEVKVSAGAGGTGGMYGTGSNGFPQIFGGGGGGGGGILINGNGPSGTTSEEKSCHCGNGSVAGQTGMGGMGYGSGGGGLGNGVSFPAGNGAPGVVYIEW